MTTPSGTPTKSRWARMGGAVRRASSVLPLARPTTPSIASTDRDADTTSLKGSLRSSKSVINAPPALSPPAPAISHPSPIAESPAVDTSKDEVPAVEVPAIADPKVEPTSPEVAQSPVDEYTPPPLIDSTAVGPGGFTDDLEEMPQPQVIKDPSFVQADPEPTDGNESTTSAADQPVTPPAVTTEPLPESSATDNVESQPASEPSTPEPVMPPPGLPNPDSYFDLPVQEDPVSETEPEDAQGGFKRELPDDVFSVPSAHSTASEPVSEDTIAVPDEAESATGPVNDHEELQPLHEMPIAQPSASPSESAVPPQENEVPESASEIPTPEIETPSPRPAVLPPAAPAYTLPLEFQYGQEVWGGVVNANKAAEETSRVENGHASSRSKASSVHMPLEDPFEDPITPVITVSQPEVVMMPHPHISEPHLQQPAYSHEEARGVVMPLPPANEVIPSRSLHETASTESLRGADGARYGTDERSPLLSHQGSLRNISYLQPSAASHNIVNVSATQSEAPATWPAHSTVLGPRLHDLGWIEYHLPDSTVYYVHPTRRVTADIDLREDKKLNAITAYLDHHQDGGSAPTGMELWLMETDTAHGKHGFQPLRLWINHKQRAVTFDQSSTSTNGNARRNKKRVEEDQLDMEYRYWSFMESHPAHASLPANARVEASDVLTWSWTDRLLPSPQSVSAPFSPEECQELMSLLRTFEQNEGGLQTVVQTRIIARILLRVAQWRQQLFRPNKPLPVDLRPPHFTPPKPHRPLRRTIVDLIISCICLGIPYIYFQRSRPHRIDEESGSYRPGPLFIIGACTCVIAAIILSVSVTFLSLPGLDSFARVAGLVAILLSTFSMASTLVAIFRYKADLESPVSHVAMEGLMMLSRRSVIMALPLVFLAYAIVAFLTGITLYSFRGVTGGAPVNGLPFEDYTKWTVVGVLGVLAAMLATSLLLLRR